MAYVRKHPKSPFWSAWFTDENGQRTSRSTKQTEKREAMKVAMGYEEAAQSARAGTLAASHVLGVYNKMLAKSGQKVVAEPVETYAKRWMVGKYSTRSKRTATTYEPVIDSFLAGIGSKKLAPLTAIIPADVEAHRDRLTAGGRKPSTVRNALKIIGAMFNAALRQGLVESNPVPAVEVNDAPQQERDPFSAEEIKLLLEHAEDEWKTLIMLGGFAGMRLGDAVNLRWDNVDLTEGIITFTPQKTSRKGLILTVPMNTKLHDHLMKLAGDTGGLICSTLAKYGIGGRFGLSGRFSTLMATAGIQNRIVAEGVGKGRKQLAKGFHSLRHSFNTSLLNAGVDEKIRMSLSGHTTSRMNRRYSHAEVETLRAAVDKMEGKKPARKKRA